MDINDEVSTALVDLAAAVQEGQANGAAIAKALVDILQVLRSQDKRPPMNLTMNPPPVSLPAPEVKFTAPAINVPAPKVTVEPAPVHIEKQAPWDCEITHEWEGERIVRSYVKRIKPRS
jgi:hypothetical protein